MRLNWSTIIAQTQVVFSSEYMTSRFTMPNSKDNHTYSRRQATSLAAFFITLSGKSLVVKRKCRIFALRNSTPLHI